jgi:YaiO family outer membrane protein
MMTGRLFLKILLLSLTGTLRLGILLAQDDLNPEQEYLRIRSIAFSGDHSTAATEARKLVNAFPDYGDARILLARITAWQKDYETASAILDTLFNTDPGNSDALLLKEDIGRWSDKNIASATDLVAGYSFDRFTEPYSFLWQNFKAGASHKFGWGAGSLLVNTGHITFGGNNLNSTTEVQFEAEAYPRLSGKNYAYLDYAYSPGRYFPRHRAAAEIWQVLPAGWSVSAGLNYYYFDKNIFIGCTSVEKYAGKYWFSLKGYVYFKNIGPTSSAYLNMRRYFNDFDYLQLTLGTGTAPDESFTLENDLERLNANSLRLTYFNRFRNAMTFRIGAGYSSEEFAEETLRNRFEGHIMLTFPIGKR